MISHYRNNKSICIFIDFENYLQKFRRLCENSHEEKNIYNVFRKFKQSNDSFLFYIHKFYFLLF